MTITTQTTRPSSWPRALGIGIAVSLITAVIMQLLMAAGISPLPAPPSLVFAERLLGVDPLPMPVGLLFHTVYVTFWAVLYLRYFPQRSLFHASMLTLELWLIVLIIIFPFIGWGIAGMGVSPALIPASLLPHVLFALLLWGLDIYLPHGQAQQTGQASNAQPEREEPSPASSNTESTGSMP